MNDYMVIISWRFAILFLVAAVAISSSGCGPKVNKVELKLENDFAGLVVIRAKSDAAAPFSGQVAVPRQGELNVSEQGFFGLFRITATREDGTRLAVELLSEAAAPDQYAVWWLPDGAYIRYFFVGRRDEMERFYQLNKEHLYQIEESRLKREGNGFALKTEVD